MIPPRAPALPSTARFQRGFTLVEVLVSVAILGIVAGASLPIMRALGDNASAAQHVRREAESAGYAMERILRLLRDCPSDGASPSAGLGITIASPTQVRFTDGRGVRLDGTDLIIEDSPTSSGVLARNVTSFTLTYIASDGVTDTSATPAQAHRIGIAIALDMLELQSAAFPRVRMVSP